MLELPDFTPHELIEDWDESHGVPKATLQEMLLPHEIVATFLRNGEGWRMTGTSVPRLERS